MTDLLIVLLPGLDGTGLLFDSLLNFLPPYLKVLRLSYPTYLCMNYNDLKYYIMENIPASRRFVLLAESFSGPLALEIAAEQSKNVAALVLVATFVENPLLRLGAWTRHLVWVPWFNFPIPRRVIRSYLLGKGASSNQVETIIDVLRMVKPKVLNYRLHLVLTADAKKALRECSVPMLFLFGARDKLVTKSSIEIILGLRPDVECGIIDAPHMILQREPAVACKAIDGFLQKFEKNLS